MGRFIIILLLSFSGYIVIANDNHTISYKDSLLAKIHNASTDTVRFKLKIDLIDLSIGSSVESAEYVDDLIVDLIDDANNVGNNKYLAYGYLYKMILAHNVFNADEVNRLMTIIEPLAIQEKEDTILYRARQCVLNMMIIKDEMTLAEQESKKTLEEAIRKKSNFGEMIARSCLGNTYMMTYRIQLAIEEFEKAYQIAQELNDIYKQLELLHSLTQTYRALDDEKNWLRCLKLQKVALEGKDKASLEYKSEQDVRMLLYLSFVTYYVETNNKEMAEKYMELSEKNFSNTYSQMHLDYYYNQRYIYYNHCDMYDKALEAIDSALNAISVYEPEYYKYLYKKADLLMKTQRYKEASELYKQSLQARDSLNVSLIGKQIDQIRKSYNADKIMLERENIRNYTNKTLLVTIFVILLAIMWFIIHTFKIKKNLDKAEREMRKMSQDMEKANTAKDNFLSNISKFINTPINSIIEGSKQLAYDDNLTPEKRLTLSNNIRNTSGELMQLVNNILDLSRLEAGVMKFNTIPVSVKILIDDSITYSQLSYEIKIDAHIDSIDGYAMDTDIDRIKSVFTSAFNPMKSDQAVVVNAEVVNNETGILITIQGSLLSSDEPTQEIIIRNEINHMIIIHFKGSYEVATDEKNSRRCLKILLPVENTVLFQ